MIIIVTDIKMFHLKQSTVHDRFLEENQTEKIDQICCIYLSNPMISRICLSKSNIHSMSEKNRRQDF